MHTWLPAANVNGMSAYPLAYTDVQTWFRVRKRNAGPTDRAIPAISVPKRSLFHANKSSFFGITLMVA